ncbi:MAG: hypothetical protein HOI80_00555 [Alphaproteobacteria bacterium]|mgnify:FL=1|jgi:hypothetical protein|nr:hypothetical protein [Alphaproteobacteria bacterium]MBT5390493.1 hypothetical protein [Alphaproteobacteria bacterium]MBT5540629.1 hypothetical protein [Alphaproteobacteria bacterium]MBT5653977.1 hypothetical protein [Alphaproteobacteria bacterium]
MLKGKCLIYSLVLGMFGLVYCEYVEAKEDGKKDVAKKVIGKGVHEASVESSKGLYKKCVSKNLHKAPHCKGIEHKVVSAPDFTEPYNEFYLDEDSKTSVKRKQAKRYLRMHKGDTIWMTGLDKQLTERAGDDGMRCYYFANREADTGVTGGVLKSCCEPHSGTWHAGAPGGLKFHGHHFKGQSGEVGFCEFNKG